MQGAPFRLPDTTYSLEFVPVDCLYEFSNDGEELYFSDGCSNRYLYAMNLKTGKYQAVAEKSKDDELSRSLRNQDPSISLVLESAISFLTFSVHSNKRLFGLVRGRATQSRITIFDRVTKKIVIYINEGSTG